MEPRIRLYRQRRYAFAAPGILGPALASLLGLALAFGFGHLAVAALTGVYPSWLQQVLASPIESPGIRALLVAVGAVHGVVALLVAVGYGERVRTLFVHRLGWTPVRESEGPCRLVHEEPGLWTLHLEIPEERDDPVPASPAWRSEPAPGSPETAAVRIPTPRPLTTLRSDPGNDLLFRLDEGSAAALTRLFDPGDRLRLRWIDFPTHVGGPSLLEARSVEAAETAEPVEESRLEAA